MRIIKNMIWIVVLTVIQAVFGRLISIYGIIPNLLAAYSIITAFYTKNEKEAAYVMILAGVFSGVCVGNIFAAEVFLIGIGSVAARILSEYLRFIPALARIEVMVILTAAAIAVVGCFVIYRSIDMSALLFNILPYTLYTAAAACVIYPLIIKTMFKKTEKKLMVI